jgi:DTW domain-containing protein YfiP
MPVEVLLHPREQYRPTSTGKLIERVVSGARAHSFLRTAVPDPSLIVRPDRELWILHPRGEPLAGLGEAARDPARVQVLLLDGSWGEAAGMLRCVESWGRPVSLPLTGESRYWLREQAGPGQLSTVEALLGWLAAWGLQEAEAQLRLHFELHVYVTLRARGRKAQAAEYLAGSPLRTAVPELLARLMERRPNELTLPAEAGTSRRAGRPPTGDPGLSLSTPPTQFPVGKAGYPPP